MDENAFDQCCLDPYQLSLNGIVATCCDRVICLCVSKILSACCGRFADIGKIPGHIMDKGRPPQIDAVDPELRTLAILDDGQGFSLIR